MEKARAQCKKCERCDYMYCHAIRNHANGECAIIRGAIRMPTDHYTHGRRLPETSPSPPASPPPKDLQLYPSPPCPSSAHPLPVSRLPTLPTYLSLQCVRAHSSARCLRGLNSSIPTNITNRSRSFRTPVARARPYSIVPGSLKSGHRDDDGGRHDERLADRVLHGNLARPGNSQFPLSN